MIIRMTLVGFGADRPRAFGATDHLELSLKPGACLVDALKAIELFEKPGISVILNDRAVPAARQADTALKDGDAVACLYVMEGGSLRQK